MKYILIVVHMVVTASGVKPESVRVSEPDLKSCIADAVQAALLPNTSSACIPFIESADK